MIKRIGFAMFGVLLSASVFAQGELKFGHVNTQAIFSVMPDRAVAEKKIEESSKRYEDELMKLQTEYKNKYEELIAQQDSLPKAILDRRQKDIVDLEQRITNFRQVAYQDIQQLQQTLIAPISEKIKTAITAVGKEGGYIYVFDTSAPTVLFNSPQSEDLEVKVKTKLGIK